MLYYNCSIIFVKDKAWGSVCLKEEKMKVCAIVPSLNPDEKLIDVVTGLRKSGFEQIILVNDGSESSEYFDKLKGDDCVVLTHDVNKGKGRAMKTGIEYYLTNFADRFDGVVFCDGDNQHSPQDIVRCANALGEKENVLILGVRDFSKSNVPTRSRMGNRTMSFLFRLICGLSISDTQTGLRAMGNAAAKEFLKTKGERFEYETNMLLETKRLGIEIEEVKIETIYIEENKSSHYNTFKDSLRILKILIKFASASIISCVVDILLFALFVKIFAFLPAKQQLFIATAIARVISSVVNYFLNFKAVFKSRSDVKATIWRYYLLCAVQTVLAYFGVYWLVRLTHFNEVLMKLVTDFVLFLISFQVQRDFIFQTKRKK